MWADVRIRPLPVDFQYASSGRSVDVSTSAAAWSLVIRGRRISSTT